MELGELEVSSFFSLLIEFIGIIGVIVDVSRLLLIVGFVVTSYWDGDGWKQHFSLLR